LDVQTASGECFVKTSNGTATNIFGIDSSNRGTIGTTAASSLVLNTNDQARILIDSSGNVGIGRTPFTSPTGYPLQLRGSSQVFLQMSTSGQGDTATDGLSIGADGTRAYIIQRENAPIAIHTNNSERMRIDSSGRLLVGTTTEGQANADNLTIADSGTCGITLRSASNNFGRIYFSDGTSGDAEYRGIIQYDHSNDRMQFAANASTAMTIDSSGRLGLGTSSPSGPIHVLGSTDTGTIHYFGTSSGAANADVAINLVTSISAPRAQIYAKRVGSSPDGLLQFSTQRSGSLQTRMTINEIGNVGIGTVSPSRNLTVSDGTNAIISVQNSGLSTEGVFNAPSGGTINLAAIGSTDLTLSTNALERVRLDSSGRLLVGTSSARANMFNSTLSSVFQVEGTTHDTSSVSIVRNSNNSSTAAFVLGKSRSTAAGGSTLVNDGDTIAYLTFQGADGAQLVECASIAAYIDGTPGANDMPGRLVFSTTSNSASSPTERLRITSDAYVRLASGTGGIQFNGDTAAANALDDYEEGTWTPTLRENGNSAIWNTLTTQEGAYIKIGKQVTVFFRIVYSGLPSNVNLSYYSYLAGLPFSGASNATNSQAINIAFLKSGADDTQYHLTWSNQGTTLNVFKSQDTNSPGPMTGSEYPSVQTTIRGHFVYKTV
jgi:hypothetical protein